MWFTVYVDTFVVYQSWDQFDKEIINSKLTIPIQIDLPLFLCDLHTQKSDIVLV